MSRVTTNDVERCTGPNSVIDVCVCGHAEVGRHYSSATERRGKLWNLEHDQLSEIDTRCSRKMDALGTNIVVVLMPVVQWCMRAFLCSLSQSRGMVPLSELLTVRRINFKSLGLRGTVLCEYFVSISSAPRHCYRSWSGDPYPSVTDA
jgi:hypothetical protein